MQSEMLDAPLGAGVGELLPPLPPTPEEIISSPPQPQCTAPPTPACNSKDPASQEMTETVVQHRVVGWNIGGARIEEALDATLQNHDSRSVSPLLAFQELPRTAIGWRTDAYDNYTLVQYRADNQWRGNGVLFKTTEWRVMRRKASHLGIWLRLRSTTSQSEVWIGSGRLSTGVTADTTADEAAQYFALLPATTLPTLCAMDLNTHLYWTGPTGHPTLLPRDSRADYLAAEISTAGLKALGPTEEQRETPTSKPRRQNCRGYQIDGILYKHATCSQMLIEVDSYKQIGGDHDRVYTSLSLRKIKGPVLPPTTRPRYVTGQLPSLPYLDQDTVEALATTYTRPKRGTQYKDPPHVKTCYQIAKQSNLAEDWKRAHKLRREARDIWKKDKLERAATGSWKDFRESKPQVGLEWAVHYADVAAEQAKDPLKWTTEHFRTLFRSPQPRQVPPWTKGEHPGTPFTQDELEEAVEKGKKGKSVGMDGTSAELMTALVRDEVTKFALLEWMERIRQGEPMPHRWVQTIVTLLPKISQPEKPGDLRPISVGSAVAKLFGTLLLERTKRHIRPLGPMQCSHGGRQTCDYLSSAIKVMMLDTEWKLGLHYIKLDVQKLSTPCVETRSSRTWNPDYLRIWLWNITVGSGSLMRGRQPSKHHGGQWKFPNSEE